MGRKILGIDEAGRGAVLGPLVVGGALIDESKLQALKDLGVKDSKLLTPYQRSTFQKPIKDILDGYKLLKINSHDIDEARFSGTMNLNDMEAQHMASLINEFKPDKVYIDCVDSNPLTFKGRLNKFLRVDTILVAEHKADVNYPIVSAASILAKFERDSSVRELERKYGPLGSGYPSDPVTKTFLSEWIKGHESYPRIVRSSWATVSDALGHKKQKNLGDFT